MNGNPLDVTQEPVESADVEQVTKKFGFFDIVDQDKAKETFWALMAITLAGVLGGSLAEPASAITGASFPEKPLGLLASIGLGFAAAGIGTLVVANTRRQDTMHLFFFALLCAISFPVVIQNAIDDNFREKAEEEVATISEEVARGDLDSIEAAFGALRSSGLEASELRPSEEVRLQSSLLGGLSTIEGGQSTIARSDTIRILESAQGAGKQAGLQQVEIKATALLNEVRGERVPEE